MARRKTALDAARQRGAALVVDAGNALFKAPGLRDDAARTRAAFLLETMGRLGTFALAVGARDLNLGASFLQEYAGKAKVLALSANLTDAQGKHPFPATATTTVGGIKVGVIGVSPPGPLGEGLTGGPVLEAVIPEVKKLRPKVDLLVVLAAVPFADALQLSSQGKLPIDLVLHAHEGRGVGTAQRGEHAFVVPTGERGRQVGRLELTLDGKGPFLDLQELDRERQLVKMLDGQLASLNERMAAAKDPEARHALARSMKSMEASRKEHARKAQEPASPGRTLRLEWISLTPEVKDDPALKAAVEKIEPPGSAPH